MKKKLCIRNLLILFLISIPLFVIQCKETDINQPNNVIARIGDEIITTEDLDLTIKAIPTPYRYEYKSEQAVHDLLQNMIDWKLMAKEAIRTGLDKRTDIQAQLKKIGDHSDTKREQVLADAYIQSRLSQMEEIADKEIEDYYINNQDEFKIPERVKVKRIFFSTEAEALSAQDELKKGTSFEKIVKRQKTDSLWLHHRDSNSEMERIAFNLHKGEVSDTFKTKTSYCLLQVEEKVPSTIKGLEDSKEGIKAKLKSKKRRDLVDQIKQDLRKNTSITINQSFPKSYYGGKILP